MSIISTSDRHDDIHRINKAWASTLAGSLFGGAHSTSLLKVSPGHYRQPDSLVFTFDIAREHPMNGRGTHRSDLQDIGTVSSTLIDDFCSSAETAMGQNVLLGSLMQAYNAHLIGSRKGSMGVGVDISVEMGPLKHAVETHYTEAQDVKASTDWLEISQLDEWRVAEIHKTAELIVNKVLKDMPLIKGWKVELLDVTTLTDERTALLRWVEQSDDTTANAILTVSPTMVPASLATLRGVNRELKTVEEQDNYEVMRERWVEDIQGSMASRAESGEQTEAETGIQLRLVTDQDELE